MKYLSLLATVALISLPLAVGAHTVGQSFEQQVGDVLVDLGCDAVEFRAGEGSRCTMMLITKPHTLEWDYLPYDSVRVTVRPPSGDAWSETVRPGPDGKTSEFFYEFQEGGPHRIGVEALSAGQPIVSAEVEAAVAGSEFFTRSRTGAIIGIGLVVLCLIILGVATLRDSKQP